MIEEDGSPRLRRDAMVLSMHTYTPISYWMAMPVRNVQLWIATHNAVLKEANHAEPQ